MVCQCGKSCCKDKPEMSIVTLITGILSGIYAIYKICEYADKCKTCNLNKNNCKC
uniref:Uncharacterized protein n=1 Tax=viral metagenome TaxID=1070528 RepID=A0A6C0JAD2_9ZZZZ